MANKIRYGIKSVAYALRTDDDESGLPVYDSPVALPGAIAMKSTPVGDDVEVYADDNTHYKRPVNNGYTGELEIASLESEDYAALMNWPIDANGAVIEDYDAEPAHFALLYQISGNESGRRVAYYDCVAERPSGDDKTRTKTITPTTQTLKLTMLPVWTGARTTPKVFIDQTDDNQAVYDAFFDEVYFEESAVS